MKKISRASLSILFCFGIVLLGLNSCFKKPPPKTGFLKDYSQLKPSKFVDAEGAYSYFNPDKPLKNYDKFIINPVQVRLEEGVEKTDEERAKMQELAKYFHDQLVIELEQSDYKVVKESGPGTLLLRTALTNVKPAKRVLNAVPTTMVSGMGLGSASGEAELLDALTGEVVAAAIDTQKGQHGFDGLTKYGNAKNVIERWAKRLVIRMDEAHGKVRPNLGRENP